MKELAVLSPIFNYSPRFLPPYYEKLKKDLDEDCIKVVRFNDEEEYIQKILYDDTKKKLTDLDYNGKLSFYKTRMMKHYIKEQILGNFKYIIVCDATDVAYNKNISQVIDVLDYYNTDILAGCEWFLWPPIEITHKYTDLPDKRQKYLNSGVILAKTEEFLKRIDSILINYPDHICDDQGPWHAEYLTTDLVKLDFENKLVLNTFGVPSYYTIENNKVTFTDNIDPIFIHDNGGPEHDTVKIVKYFQ